MPLEPIQVVEGPAAPLPRDDVDTDQIIPKQFLKRITRTGYGDVLFHDWRYRDDGTPDPGFVLNRPEYRDAVVLVTGRNFGCGSSREHAVWALRDYGFRAVIAPSFADIFLANCFQAGLVPVRLSAGEAAALVEAVSPAPLPVRVDLRRMVVEAAGRTMAFELDPEGRRRLMEGLDEIDLTLQEEAAIAAYEAGRG